MLPVLHIPTDVALPDNDVWQNRFQIQSATSNRIYVVSQHRKKKHWACSCPGWKIHRKCKHLQSLSIPCKEQPYEVHIIQE